MGRHKLDENDIGEDDIVPKVKSRVATVLTHKGFPMTLKDVADDQASVIEVNRKWRDRLTEVEKLGWEELENIFYAAGTRGAGFDDVCKYFGIKATTAYNYEELRKPHESGLAELRMRLRHVQIEEALTKKNPLMLIWVSKNFGGMSDDGTTSLQIDEHGGGTLGIFPSAVRVQANRDATGTTLGPATESPLVEGSDDAPITHS